LGTNEGGGQPPEADPWPREPELLDRARSGEVLDLGMDSADPESMKAWGRERAIRASVLRGLLVDQVQQVHQKGVRLRGVRISGLLDLEAATVRCPLRLDHCYLDTPWLVLNYAAVSVLTLTGCVLAGLAADTLTVTHELDLSGSLFTAPVLLSGAEITGSLKFGDARLEGANAEGNALIADNLKVGGSVYLRNGFTAAGAVWLVGADITGNLECDGATLNGPNATRLALVAERLKVGGSVFLRNGFTAAGAISLLGADITGNLECDGAVFNGTDTSGNALLADGLKVLHSVLLRNEFTTAGAVRLLGADITGNLECDGAVFNGTDTSGNTVVADNLKVGHDALFRNGFTTAGAISLLGADITGNLECDGATLNRAGPKRLALVAERLKTGGATLLRNGFTTAVGGISLIGADITGNVDLSGATLDGTDTDGDALVADNLKVGHDALFCNEFTTAGAISLLGADITGNLEYSGAKLNGANTDGNVLVADGLTVGHDAFFDDGFTAAGGISLLGANIAGNLECSGAKLNGADTDRNALAADGLTVGHDALLDEVFTAAGGISLLGVRIAGNLQCGGAKLNGTDTNGNALIADNLNVGGDALLTQKFIAAGGISLIGAGIGGNLDFNGATLNGGNTAGFALVADGVTIGRNALLRNGFTATGVISLIGAGIGGNLECDGATLNGASTRGYALVADNLTIGRNALLRNGFTAAGAIWLLGADITGNLECDDATLKGVSTDGLALAAGRIKVGGDAFFRSGFSAAGAISLLGADITGNLDFNGAELGGANAAGNALIGDNLEVGRNACFAAGFTAAGTVSLGSARIGGSLELCIGKPPGAGAAFDAPGMQVTHELRWMPDEQFTGPVNLEDAQIGQLKDDWSSDRGSANGYWPSGGLLRLDGFSYTRLADEPPATAEQRLTWIQSQYRDKPPVRWRDVLLRRKAGRALDSSPMFAAQPYEKLASVYQQGGQDKEARIIALARRRDIRKYGDLTRYRKALNWLLDRTIQYGYKTWRAVLALALVYAAALVIFWIAQHHTNLIVPVMDTTSSPVPTALHCTSSYPCFYPAGYAIDVVIPIINVHQAGYWGPNGHVPWGTVLIVFSWLGTAFGWALATLAVAGYTGLARNSDTI
jgi:predicted acyltransferase (DUF342 family)